MLIQQRNIALAIVLSIVTCGIYNIYWTIVLTNEVGHLSYEPKFTGGKAFLLMLVTCGIYTFFWFYQLAKNIEKAQQAKGVPAKDNVVLFIVLALFGLGIVSMAIAQNDVNQLV